GLYTITGCTAAAVSPPPGSFPDDSTISFTASGTGCTNPDFAYWMRPAGGIASHLDSLERSLQRQGLRVDRYLEYLGKTPQQWIDDERPEAEEHVKADLVLN